MTAGAKAVPARAPAESIHRIHLAPLTASRRLPPRAAYGIAPLTAPPAGR